jgi:hypothetical protein
MLNHNFMDCGLTGSLVDSVLKSSFKISGLNELSASLTALTLDGSMSCLQWRILGSNQFSCFLQDKKVCLPPHIQYM